MENKKYRWILYFIIITILTTISVQIYWNYKNYDQNKQRVLNEIQISLNDAVNSYFTDLSKDKFYAVIRGKDADSSTGKNIFKNLFPGLKRKKNTVKKNITTKDSVDFKINSISFSSNNASEFKSIDSAFINSMRIKKDLDTNKSLITIRQDFHQSDKNSIKHKTTVFTGRKAIDSLKILKNLETIFISIQSDTIDIKKLDSLVSNRLKSKKIQSDYSLKHFKSDTLFNSSLKNNTTAFLLETNAQTSFLKKDEQIKLQYSNPTYEALKRSSIGILLSFLLSLAVISSLFYLLKIINQQKELAEIKNDLISNITHEFKTPITTISTAIEAIENFNMIDDKEKTKKYLSLSSFQLKKLHQMVEKLLETATLDSEKLMLKKETVDITDVIERIVNKHRFVTTDKTINFSTNKKEIVYNVDVFHFENAISNLIDNAIKYGGDIIEVNINSVLNNIEISVADNGKGIEKQQQEKIFDKFYRVPKGNTHDVKGFGIGLYYTKKIVEKHLGTISLSSVVKRTIFKIDLPND
ncbi:sensor histidine kinase [Tenacibaculum retecalamus]|uniref:sensor histidine kinase n=1 Tax=Tenacibaculum retecalamus TaxID=3018315 RepID=UPI0023D96953|nr:HAMP domain-containing sensor histidine kinase [Tenacibaculum retecalamus]WBX71708.1 HAMP domain-containing sensor histidine kinase [Tenacibaculum retecalamus]